MTCYLVISGQRFQVHTVYGILYPSCFIHYLCFKNVLNACHLEVNIVLNNTISQYLLHLVWDE